jgi:hypothetical protein
MMDDELGGGKVTLRRYKRALMAKERRQGKKDLAGRRKFNLQRLLTLAQDHH